MNINPFNKDRGAPHKQTSSPIHLSKIEKLRAWTQYHPTLTKITELTAMIFSGCLLLLLHRSSSPLVLRATSISVGSAFIAWIYGIYYTASNAKTTSSSLVSNQSQDVRYSPEQVVDPEHFSAAELTLDSSNFSIGQTQNDLPEKEEPAETEEPSILAEENSTAVENEDSPLVDKQQNDPSDFGDVHSINLASFNSLETCLDEEKEPIHSLNPPLLETKKIDGMNPSLIEDKPPIINQKNAEPGKWITYTYQDENTVYGEEKVERIDTIANLKNNLTKQLGMLHALLSKKQATEIKHPSSELKSIIQYIQREIALCQKFLNNANLIPHHFINTTFYRDQLGKVVAENANYLKSVNAICLGAPVNFRYHTCQIANKNIGFFRLGVITDPRNGFTHLGELNKLQREKEKLKLKRESLSTKFSEIYREENKFSKSAAYGYALNQFQTENIEKAIQERRHILHNQMLQLVQGQIEKNFKKLARYPQHTFHLTHLSLLNRKTNKIDKTGWVHNEDHQMADMYKTFKEFAGKKLIFDGTGPYIDLQGHVHLAQSLYDSKGLIRQMQLETHFINISVQGHTENDGRQKHINQKQLTKLLDFAEKKFKSSPHNEAFKAGLELLLNAQERLNQGQSNYQIAEDISVALLKLEIALSIGCFGAKDRTGYVCTRTVLRFMIEAMQTHPHLKTSPKTLRRLTEEFEKSILSEEACPIQIVKDNTGKTILKCSPFKLPGYSRGFKGKANRIIYYFKQLTNL